MSKKFIIASDIDGTLIDKDLKLPQNNKTAVKKFTGMGGEFVIASGRSPQSIKKFKDMLMCSERCIVYNGAGVYDFSKNDFAWKSVLSKDILLPLVQSIIDEFSDVGVELWCDDGRVYQLREGFDNTAREILEGVKFSYANINDNDIPESFFKILVSGKADRISRVWDFCKANQPECAVSVCSCPIYCEILNENANKMSALNALVSLENNDAMSIAIGDYYNDMEMIMGADFSAAPENAAEEIKNEADLIVCDCRRGAVAELIDYVIKHFMEVS